MAFGDINPSISTLIQNAQRVNPEYGKETKKQRKLDRMKTGRSMDTSTDTTNMSDDMLGDMDPDEYKERDHTEAFKRKLKQWQEEQKNNDVVEEEEEEEESGASEEDEFEEEEEKKPGASEEDEFEEEEEQNAPVDDEDEVEMDEEDLEEETEEEADDEKIRRLTQEIYQKTKEQAEEEGTPLKQVTTWEELFQKVLAADEDEHSSVTLTEEERKKLELLEEGNSKFTSLLSYDDGFIIADPKKKVMTSASEELEDVKTELEEEEEKRNLIPPSIRARYDNVFDELILSEAGKICRYRLCQYLTRFGVKVLEDCTEKGVRVLIIPKNKSLKDYTDMFTSGFENDWSNVRWGFFPDYRLVILGEEVILDGSPMVNVPVLYFAFAFDYSLGSEGFASENSPAVLANFQSCQNNNGNLRFIDSFASISPKHYFAQAVEAFLTAPHGVLIPDKPQDENILCTKEQLYDIDRPIFSYIEYLFNKINKGAQ